MASLASIARCSLACPSGSLGPSQGSSKSLFRVTPSVSLPQTASSRHCFRLSAAKDEFVKGGRLGPEELQQGLEDATHDIQDKATEVKDNIQSGIQAVGDKIQEATGQTSQNAEDAAKTASNKTKAGSTNVKERAEGLGDAIARAAQDAQDKIQGKK